MQATLLVRAERWALLLLVFLLPLMEAPKNIALVIYLVLWGVNRWRSGEWGGRWAVWDSLILLLITTTLSSAMFGAFVPDKGIGSANDVLAYGLLFTAVRRSRYEPEMLRHLVKAASSGTLVGLVFGYWAFLVAKTGPYLVLHSVGHVNHSAIYLAIVLVVSIVWVEASQKKTKLFLLAASGLMFVSLFVTQARGAIIPVLIFLLIWAGMRNKSALAFGRSLLLLAVLVTTVLELVPGAMDKTRSGVSSGEIGSYRPALARVATLAVREYPWLGVGVNNFGKITPTLTEQWQQKSGRIFSNGQLFFASHAHNIYMTTLAERGVLGLLPLLAFLAAIAFNLLRSRRASFTDPLNKALWGGALGVWVIAVVGGLFNTTLHHEHAMISMLFIAIWLQGLSRNT